MSCPECGGKRVPHDIIYYGAGICRCVYQGRLNPPLQQASSVDMGQQTTNATWAESYEKAKKEVDEAQLFEAFKKINPNDPEVAWAYKTTKFVKHRKVKDHVPINIPEIHICDDNFITENVEVHLTIEEAFKLWLENYRAKQDLKKLLGD